MKNGLFLLKRELIAGRYEMCKGREEEEEEEEQQKTCCC
jgi:hypothetical protein